MGMQDIVDALLRSNGQQRSAWLDRNVNRASDALHYYGGPAAEPLVSVAKLLASASPGADMMDMREQGGNLMHAKSPMGALQAGAGLGAATLGMFIPGTAKGISEGVEGAAKGIRAYHGSPHDFDRFSMDKIGTGEGAQAYGHGLYFAENDNVAESYKHAVSGRQAKHTFDGKPVETSQDWWGLEDQLNASGDWRTAKLLKEYAAKIEPDPALRFSQLRDWHRNNPEMMAAIDGLEKRISTDTPKGKMYEVNINADPDDFLDWDKPLSEQSEKVRNYAATRGIRNEEVNAFDQRSGFDMRAESKRRFGTENVWELTPDQQKELNDLALGPAFRKMYDPRGDALYEMLAEPPGPGILNRHNAEMATSDHLREAGIPGIRYLDAGSRTAGDGSRNYVVFDDKLVSILRKYGLMGGVLGMGAAATQGYGPDERS